MRVGVILVGYNTEDLIGPCLAPWIEARQTRLGGNTFIICAVNVPFVGFDNDGQDGTRDHLERDLGAGYIDHLIVSDTPMKETEARSEALRWLKTEDVETVIQVDSDEQFALTDISRVFAFVAANPFACWFRLCLKNYVGINGDNKTYLVEPFTPPRIHRIRLPGGFTAYAFNQDNDICYTGGITRDVKRQEQFASMTVPKESVWIRHLSWLSDSRSKAKVEYQRKRWGHSSFRWDEVSNQLRFDESYYATLGQPLPETARDESPL